MYATKIRDMSGVGFKLIFYEIRKAIFCIHEIYGLSVVDGMLDKVYDYECFYFDPLCMLTPFSGLGL